MKDERLYLSLRRRRGRTTITIADTSTRQELTLPLHMAARFLRNRIPAYVMRQLHLVKRAWHDDAAATTVWIESPEDAREWLNQRAVNKLAATSHPSEGDVVLSSLSSGEVADLQNEEEIPHFDQLRRCTELALHSWPARSPAGRPVACTTCGAAPDRLRLDSSNTAPVLAGLLSCHVWKAPDGLAFAMPREPADQPPPLRLLLDLEAIDEDQQRALAAHLVGSDKSDLELAGLGDADIPDAITRLRGEQQDDQTNQPEGRLVLSHPEYPSQRDLGSVSQLERLTIDVGGGQRGSTRATLLASCRAGGFVLVTDDEELLDLDPMRGVYVLDSRQAVVLAGIRLRYRDRLQALIGRGARLSIPAWSFNQARSLALVPGLADAFNRLFACVRSKQAPDRATRLYRGCLSRLALLAEAEDRLAFLWFFPQERKSSDDESWYHLEFLLLLAQALLEGLKALAGESIGLAEDRPGWRSFLERLAPRNESLHRFLTSSPGRDVLEIVRALRYPLAHAEHWLGTSHYRGSTDPVFVSQMVRGDAAIQLARSVVRLRENPEDWGIEAWAFDVRDPEVRLKGYPFAVSLNVRLLWFAHEFVRRIQWPQAEPDVVSQIAPWELTNPPLTEEVHELVRAMSWQLPD
jgi:hypothetical protein